jgi:putative phosphoesterase
MPLTPVKTRDFTIGLISDTHNVLRPEAREALDGVAHILHAGDICDDRVLVELAALAPVTAVRGNNDRGKWARSIRTTEMIEIGGVLLYMVHDIADLDIDPRAAGVHAVIYGHSHKPLIEERDGVVFVNPGSAGPRRFSLPVSVGFLQIKRGIVSASLKTLKV